MKFTDRSRSCKPIAMSGWLRPGAFCSPLGFFGSSLLATENRWHFEQVPQMLLPGDNSDLIPIS